LSAKLACTHFDFTDKALPTMTGHCAGKRLSQQEDAWALGIFFMLRI